MFYRRVAALVGAAAIVAAGCGAAASPTPAGGGGATVAPGAGCTVGVSWNNYQEERWAKWDEPALKAAIEAGGGTYISNDAKASAETQASNTENLISQGAKVLVILAQDGTAIKPSVASAISQGVPVIAYDRLIEDPPAVYITFKNVGESYTDNRDPAIAQTNMEQFLTANNNDVDAVVASNDGMAGGVVAALAAQGLAGKVPASGQDGDLPALNRVALGTQTVD